MKKPNDITGRRFGMLTVLSYDHSFNHNTYWLCKCDCGNTKVVKRGSLMGGDIVSCGCYRNKLFMKNRQDSEHEDLSKFKFSMLTPICRDYEAEQRYSYPKTMWKCQCDCGNIITVAAEKLKTGSTKSCGCYKRTSGEAQIAELLDNNGIDYLYDKPCFDDLVLPGGSIGRYDFVLFDGQHKPYRIIEFDGEEHKAGNKPSALYSEARLNQIRQYDAIKNEYAMKHGIPLVRIPYSEKRAITLDLLFSDKYLVST